MRPLRRDGETVQIGTDPRRARALTGLGKAAAVISLLDGSRDEEAVARTAGLYGIPRRDAERVIELLAAADLLDDFPADLRAALPGYLRGRLGPEMACAALAYGHADGGAAVLARRRQSFIQVYGAGRVGAAVATLLAASGVGWVGCLDSGTAEDADVTPAGLRPADTGTSRAAAAARAVRRVAPETRTDNDASRPPALAVIAGWPDPLVTAALMRDRVPHLVVRAEEAIGVVGPFVRPGRTACVRCVDLGKTDRDPAWPRILAQASYARPPAATQACDTVLATATAALATAQALTCVDRVGEPAAANGTLELVLPGWRWQRRAWPGHPACPCGAASPGGVPRERLPRTDDVRAALFRSQDVRAARLGPEDVGTALFRSEDVGAARLGSEDVGAALFLAKGVKVLRLVCHGDSPPSTRG